MITWINALEQAFHVNMALPPCPFSPECARRYPNMDLYGKHSIIDTAFSYRISLIEIACRSQPPQVLLEANQLLEAARPHKYGMEQAAVMLQTADLAAVLFDMSGSPEYREMKSRLLELPVLREYHKSLSAVEHMAGLKETEITSLLKDHCSHTLGHTFSMDAYRSRIHVSPQEAEKLLPPPSAKHSESCTRHTDPAVLKGALKSALTGRAKGKSGPAR